MIEEFEEKFSVDGTCFSGIWTDFDHRSPVGDAGVLSCVARILVSDEDAIILNAEAEILRLGTGVKYLVKTSTRSGVGMTELDLEKKNDQPYQGEF